MAYMYMYVLSSSKLFCGNVHMKNDKRLRVFLSYSKELLLILWALIPGNFKCHGHWWSEPVTDSKAALMSVSLKLKRIVLWEHSCVLLRSN